MSVQSPSARGQEQGLEESGAVPSSGFLPVIDEGARLLILGSLPGLRSIRDQQYFAHPRNVFWRIMGDIAGVDEQLPYVQRCVALTRAGIAVWDVLASSIRRGSLDTAIKEDSIKINNFRNLLDTYPQISSICFNGNTARRLFDRHVLGTLDDARIPPLITLPSTSPTHAAMPYDEKLKRWSVIRDLMQPPR